MIIPKERTLVMMPRTSNAMMVLMKWRMSYSMTRRVTHRSKDHTPKSCVASEMV